MRFSKIVRPRAFRFMFLGKSKVGDSLLSIFLQDIALRKLKMGQSGTMNSGKLVENLRPVHDESNQRRGEGHESNTHICTGLKSLNFLSSLFPNRSSTRHTTG